MRRFLPASIAMAAFLAGCGSSTTASSGQLAGSNSSGNSGTPGANGACPPAADVNTALGLTVSEAVLTSNPPVTLCQYAQGGNSAKVLINIATGQTLPGFQAAKTGVTDSGQTAHDISGLGDAAYSSSLGSGEFATNTVIALKGSTQVLVTTQASEAQIQAYVSKLLAGF